MAKDPALLFYSNDFLTGVADLTMEERGQYITLLCLEHQKGRLSDKAIKMVCHGFASADVLSKFKQDESGLWYNDRLEIEIQKRKQHSNKQRDRAIEGWKKRKDEQSHGNATALPLENEIENINVLSINNKNSQNFPQKPKPEDCGDLPEQTVKDCIEIYQIRNYKTITSDQVKAYWPIWLRSTYNGTKWAPNIEAVRSHFLNAIKNEKFEDIKNAGPQGGLSERDRKTIEKMKG